MRKYSKEHQWVSIGEDGIATIGITKFAADELGEITFVELPEMGKSFKTGDQLCAVESVKACSDVFAPVGGTVCAVNDALDKSPEGLNSDPEGIAWLCKLANPDTGALDALMDGEAYAAFCK